MELIKGLIFPLTGKRVYTLKVKDGAYHFDYNRCGVRFEHVMQALFFRDLLREAGFTPTEESAVCRTVTSAGVRLFQ